MAEEMRKNHLIKRFDLSSVNVKYASFCVSSLQLHGM